MFIVANEANVSMLRDEKIRVVERQWIVPLTAFSARRIPISCGLFSDPTAVGEIMRLRSLRSECRPIRKLVRARSQFLGSFTRSVLGNVLAGSVNGIPKA